MNLMDMIKSDRVMSMNHWRFKLMHWMFFVPDWRRNKLYSPLPAFLYSHYCPLFHFTNALCLVAPVVMPFVACIYLIQKLVSLLPKQQRLAPVLTEQDKHNKNVNQLLHWFEYDRSLILFGLDNFKHWDEFSEDINREQVWQDAIIAYTERVERESQKELKKAERTKAIVSIVNFSRTFFRGCFYSLYILIALFISWATYQYGQAVINILISLDWLFFVEIALKILLISLTGCFVVFGFIGMLLYTPVGPCFTYTATKTVNIGNSILTPIFNIIGMVCEFIGMFYEENCPKILIKDEE